MRRRGIVAIVITALTALGSSSVAGGADSTTDPTIRVVNQNLLHGTACAPATNRCDLPDRAALFVRQLEWAKCPTVVAIEEGNRRTVAALRRAHVARRCHYRLVYDGDPGQDREIVLTTGHVVASERHRLAGPLRTAYWVRIATAAGAVDLLATHLASSSDDRPCDAATCPPPCEANDTVNTCQGRQAAALLAAVRSRRSVAVLAGDLNAQPDEPTITALKATGLVDTHDEIGAAECDAATGSGCTSGRVDDALTDMKNPQSRQSERIDYVFLAPTPRCRVVAPTGVFAAGGGPTTGSGLVFPADHSAVEASLRCRTTPADRAAARRAPTTTTTRSQRDAAVGRKARRAVTAAFDGLFAPNPDPDAQLSHLERAAELRDSFIARRAQVGDLANHTAVRIDSFDRATARPPVVDVTFSILVNGAVVLDSLPGQAKLVDGKWLVSTSTYCQVATLGVSTIPEACRASP